MDLILASGSPRRQELLSQMGFTFEVFTREFEEHFPSELPASEVAAFLALEKNNHYRPFKPDYLIITADTTVVCQNQVLNKPEDRQEAQEMLMFLSNKTHQVISGVCVSTPDRQVTFSDVTEVTFEMLTPAEIDYYLDHYKPYDKAGAYGIQEWLGMNKVKALNGSYFNVMGLPTHSLYRVLVDQFAYLPNRSGKI